MSLFYKDQTGSLMIREPGVKYQLWIFRSGNFISSNASAEDISLNHLGLQIEQMVSDTLDGAAETGELFTVSADALREMLQA